MIIDNRHSKSRKNDVLIVKKRKHNNDRKRILHIRNVENVETENSKEGFDLGEESTNKTESKDQFGTFEAKKNN